MCETYKRLDEEANFSRFAVEVEKDLDMAIYHGQCALTAERIKRDHLSRCLTCQLEVTA
jgi:hypothetical protein